MTVASSLSNASNVDRRLLVIRQSALGDIVNALYSLPAIRSASPGSRVTWVVDDRFRELFDAVEGVDDVIVFPRRRWGRWIVRPWRWPQLLFEWHRYTHRLRGMHFDWAVDLHDTPKSRLTFRRVRADVAVRFEPPDATGRCDPMGLPGDGPVRMPLRAAQFAATLQRAGVQPLPAPFPWRIPVEAARVIDAYFRDEGLAPGSPAVIHPGSSPFGAYKRWPAERFAELAARLAGAGIPVIVIWGPGERDAAGRVVASAGLRGPGVRLAPETRPLSVLIALLSRAGVFVGNDSGPLHVASACGTPTVGLYGPKDPTVYAPGSPPRAVLCHLLPCSPCASRRCHNPECMRALSVDTVFKETLSMLRDRIDRPFRGVPLRRPWRTMTEGGERRLPVDARAPSTGPFRFFRAGAWRWTVHPQEAGPLADAAMRSEAGLPGTSAGGNPRRQFLRTKLCRFAPDGSVDFSVEGRNVFLKVYPVRSLVQRLRSMLGRSQARVEFCRLHRLHAGGAPVPEPIAFGQGPAADAVVLEDLGGIPTVRDLLLQDPPEGARRAILYAVADAIVSLHGTGFIHEDLHAGNLLCHPTGAIRIVDVQRGYFVSPPGIPDRALSLAHLLFSLSELTRETERVRILRRYTDRLEWPPECGRLLAGEVAKALARIRRRYVLRQMRRAREGGSRLEVFRTDEGDRVYAAEGVRSWMSQSVLVEGVLKDEAGRRVLKVLQGGRRLALKEESRRRRGLREWAGLHGWRAAGLPAPTPFYLVVPPSGPIRLAAEWAEGFVPVSQWVEDRCRAGASLAWRRAQAWRLGRLLRRIHTRGLFHADLKAGNILVREGAGGAAEFRVLDHDRLSVCLGPVAPDAVRINLAQVNASIAAPVTCTDRLRCFRAYASREPALRRAWKDVVRDVMRRTVARRHRWPVQK